MMLWGIDGIREDLREVVDDDPTVCAERASFMMVENNYTGPYTGPESVRRFVVIGQGIRSCFCLCVYLVLS